MAIIVGQMALFWGKWPLFYITYLKHVQKKLTFVWTFFGYFQKSLFVLGFQKKTFKNYQK